MQADASSAKPKAFHEKGIKKLNLAYQGAGEYGD
jgi:hypothetical protein